MRQYEEILEKDGIYATLVYIITHILWLQLYYRNMEENAWGWIMQYLNTH